MRVLDVFLLYCLTAPSPDDTPAEIARIGRNQQQVAARGREPGLLLEAEDGPVSLQDWGHAFLAACEPIAALLDRVTGESDAHAQALAHARRSLDDPEQLSSARMLRALASDHGNDFLAFGLERSRQARDWVLAQPWDAGLQAHFQAMSAQSVREQARIEAADTLPFEQYRQQYIAPERLGLGRGAIAPGLTLVEATEYVPQARHDQYLQGRAIQRPQVPQDVNAAALFLLSQGSGFITGQLLAVNGGFVMH